MFLDKVVIVTEASWKRKARKERSEGHSRQEIWGHQIALRIFISQYRGMQVSR